MLIQNSYINTKIIMGSRGVLVHLPENIGRDSEGAPLQEPDKVVPDEGPHGVDPPLVDGLVPDILFLKHACSILRQSSSPVCGSWKSQASSLWAKQHRA